MPAILFDLGGTHIRCAVARTCSSPTNATLERRVKRHIPNFLTHSAPATVWDELLQLICGYVVSVADLVGPSDPVIIGFPGPIDSEGRIVAAPTIIGRHLSVPDIRAQVSSATARPTFLLNDMSAAAWHLSCVTDSKRFIAVTVSSGIGSKLFDRTSSGGVIDDVPYAGEIGHVTVDNGPLASLCDCGSRGHLGSIASGRGVRARGERIVSYGHSAPWIDVNNAASLEKAEKLVGQHAGEFARLLSEDDPSKRHFERFNYPKHRAPAKRMT